jgi:hypothetical protein
MMPKSADTARLYPAPAGREAGSVSTRPRRCVVCRTKLPKQAGPRRRYCGNGCAAKAYRLRKRRKFAGDMARGVTKAYALVVPRDGFPDYGEPLVRTAAEFIAKVRCPVCGTVTWPGVRRRRDARYCSNRCRQRAWRERHQHERA